MCRALEDMFSAEQVHMLASQYGGNSFLLITLDNCADIFHHQFLEINISGKEVSDAKDVKIRCTPGGKLTPRPLLQDICRILNLRYEEREDSFYLPKEQQPLLTLDTIKEAYQRTKRTPYFPSISNSAGPYKSFSLRQRSAPEGVHQTVNIYVGDRFSKENPLPPREISLLQKTLLEYCPALPELNYTWRTETAKDLVGWEEAGMGP